MWGLILDRHEGLDTPSLVSATSSVLIRACLEWGTARTAVLQYGIWLELKSSCSAFNSVMVLNIKLGVNFLYEFSFVFRMLIDVVSHRFWVY